MEKYIWSPSLMGFFPTEEQSQFESVNKWPSDGIEVSAEQHDALFPVPEGQYIDTVDGFPAWVDTPPPTHEEEVTTAEQQRQQLLFKADEVTADWRVELLLGDINNEDKEKLSAWMDYKKQVKAVDTSTAPDINWPTPPVV